MKVFKFVLPLAIFLALAGFLAKGLELNPREVPSPFIGKPAPAFALTRLDDETKVVKRDELLGKVWILNVWASWCAPCREEHPLLVEFARTKTVLLVGLNYKDKRDAARQWLVKLGDPYDMTLVDSSGETGIDYGVYGVPETFVVDRQGIVRMKHIGPLTPEVMSKKLAPLLQQLGKGQA
jgi:cytochrome c biogenesis protein CcmG/thiol:disulfide interchange protein DsbE